ncbi:hypothetical protein AAF712_012897 [Marasmius tenuissimus]|uniref:Uncharacterized protein n=1 Tax=Marasmius tenuissimus TaxID=585030 RepID=A0ABR2ZHA9_9AGAR
MRPAGPPEQGTSRTSAAPAKTRLFWSRNANEVTIAALLAVQKTVPLVPGLATACITLAELLKAIDDSKENKKAFEDLAKDALSLIDAIYGGCEDVVEQRNPTATISQLNSHAKALTK